eukprot:3529870-Pleurochrysis_carterae.AAC.3
MFARCRFRWRVKGQSKKARYTYALAYGYLKCAVRVRILLRIHPAFSLTTPSYERSKRDCDISPLLGGRYISAGVAKLFDYSADSVSIVLAQILCGLRCIVDRQLVLIRFPNIETARAGLGPPGRGFSLRDALRDARALARKRTVTTNAELDYTLFCSKSKVLKRELLLYRRALY